MFFGVLHLLDFLPAPFEIPHFPRSCIYKLQKCSLQCPLRKCKRKPAQVRGTDFLLSGNAEEGEEAFSSAFPQPAAVRTKKIGILGGAAMKKPWGKWFLFVLVLLAAVIGIPVIINESYKTNSGYMTMWSAADLLAYYGTIIASVGAAAGVFVSIKVAAKNYKEDVRARVMPFIAVTPFERKAIVNTMALLKEKVEKTERPAKTDNTPAVQYDEYKLSQIYFVITEHGIDAKNGLDKSQQAILEHAGNSWVSVTGGLEMLQRTDFYSMPLEIENVGNGTAVNLRIGFNRVGDRNTYRFIRPMMLKQSQTVYIHIFSTADYDIVRGDYSLEFLYEDIYGNKYSQEFPVEYGKNKDNQEYQSIDLVGKQLRKTEATPNANT